MSSFDGSCIARSNNGIFANISNNIVILQTFRVTSYNLFITQFMYEMCYFTHLLKFSAIIIIKVEITASVTFTSVETSILLGE